MANMQFGLVMRAQFPPEDDMQMRFQELLEQARLIESVAGRLPLHSLRGLIEIGLDCQP